jgi:pyruvate dehydrogenase E2 component (dihydrolipoamide acetyltransferase)
MITLKSPQIDRFGKTATIWRWLKNPGDAVAEDEILFEAETEDALVEITAGHSGTLNRILAPTHSTFSGMAPVAQIDPAGSSPEIPAPNPEQIHPPRPAGPVVPILMPQASQSMEEGTIVKWHVAPGARIKKGQIIFDIETDKAVVEIEATDEGRLARIVVAEDGTIGVKKPVAYLAESDTDVEAQLANMGASSSGESESARQAKEIEAPARAASISEDRADGRRRISPAAKRIARERGIDLLSLGSGSGPGGRILSFDLPQAGSQRPGAGPSRRKLSKMRKEIAATLQASKQTIPHFYVRMTFDAGPAFAFYKEQKARFACSINDVITAACARCIAEFPQFRSRIDQEEIVEVAGVNIGIAVSVEEGLVVPVLVRAEKMSLSEIAGQTRRVVENARKGRLEGVGRAVFTITNLGMFGVEEFAAIINPPECAILAVGAARESVLVKDGVIRAGRVMTLTLSCDHRMIDGHLASQFLSRVKELLEAPAQLADSPS